MMFQVMNNSLPGILQNMFRTVWTLLSKENHLDEETKISNDIIVFNKKDTNKSSLKGSRRSSSIITFIDEIDVEKYCLFCRMIDLSFYFFFEPK